MRPWLQSTSTNMSRLRRFWTIDDDWERRAVCRGKEILFGRSKMSFQTSHLVKEMKIRLGTFRQASCQKSSPTKLSESGKRASFWVKIVDLRACWLNYQLVSKRKRLLLKRCASVEKTMMEIFLKEISQTLSIKVDSMVPLTDLLSPSLLLSLGFKLSITTHVSHTFNLRTYN